MDVCRRKWKSLRDRYMKEKRSEKEAKKSGSAAGTSKKWKFFVVLSFLDPFVTPRETTSNLPRVAEDEIEDDGAAETSLSGAGEAYEECDEAAGPSHNTGLLTSEDTYTCSFCIMGRFCIEERFMVLHDSVTIFNVL